MSLDLLKQNINREKKIVTELVSLDEKIVNGEIEYSEDMNKGMNSLFSQLSILNNAIPDLLENIDFYKKLDNKKPPQAKSANLTKIDYKENNISMALAVRKKDEDKFLEHLTTEKFVLNKLKAVPTLMRELWIIRTSNKLFGEYSKGLIKQGHFRKIKDNLKKITFPLTTQSYVSLVFFITLCSIPIGILLSLTLFFFAGLLPAILLFFLLPLLIFSLVYFYPLSKKRSLEHEVNQELPFLVIYMAAISTSGIEPSKIFQILSTSKEYPFSKREIKKLNNYINFYGYDLVSALKAVAKTSPSDRLALLFDGLATTITSGGELTSFLDKHSETLLFDYKLEREKYTHTAETFMNIYISIVVAAPMIMMILFVLITLTGFGQGFMTPAIIGIMTILVVAFLNVLFLTLLNLKQPKF